MCHGFELPSQFCKTVGRRLLEKNFVDNSTETHPRSVKNLNSPNCFMTIDSPEHCNGWTNARFPGNSTELDVQTEIPNRVVDITIKPEIDLPIIHKVNNTICSRK